MTGSAVDTDVISKAEARRLIADVFEETALVLGGLLAVHRAEDEFVWRLVKTLDVIRCKAARRIDECDASPGAEARCPETHLRPHPAIEDFLLKLRRS
jgi:hypothetical protein